MAQTQLQLLLFRLMHELLQACALGEKQQIFQRKDYCLQSDHYKTKAGVKTVLSCLNECLSGDSTCIAAVYSSASQICFLSWKLGFGCSPMFPTYRGEFINLKLHCDIYVGFQMSTNYCQNRQNYKTIKFECYLRQVENQANTTVGINSFLFKQVELITPAALFITPQMGLFLVDPFG